MQIGLVGLTVVEGARRIPDNQKRAHNTTVLWAVNRKSDFVTKSEQGLLTRDFATQCRLANRRPPTTPAPAVLN
jgi:hypothetical protein